MHYIGCHSAVLAGLYKIRPTAPPPGSTISFTRGPPEKKKKKKLHHFFEHLGTNSREAKYSFLQDSGKWLRVKLCGFIFPRITPRHMIYLRCHGGQGGVKSQTLLPADMLLQLKDCTRKMKRVVTVAFWGPINLCVNFILRWSCDTQVI